MAQDSAASAVDAPSSTPVLNALVEPIKPAPDPVEPDDIPTKASKPSPVESRSTPATDSVFSGTLTSQTTRTSTTSTPLGQEGPFIPSVDRSTAAGFAGYGRQEPGFGSLEQATVTPDSREPSLGAIAARAQALTDAKVEPVPEPKVQVFGESRLKGDDPSAFGRQVPEFLEEEEEVSEGVGVMWLVASIVLALAIIGQSLVVFRNDIVAAAPSLRPLLVQLCQPLSCEVGYVRQIDRIFIVGSSLQQAPDAQPVGNQRAYVLRLTLQNRSTYPQPWPALMLTLTDASGTAVIKKALLPSEFLPPDLLEGPMIARKEVGLDIPLTVDGLSISGYELERFFP
ncbi:DUF3426 domain-containing protein [Orrella daihaiensis]|uniref:DUF3426 domain-containing protein n=1 Tax=Orrella daihaiensis TaxID=2782176 RepID=A0ABY4AN08_9BURK|nr:DUF3426 domain-containing protein [Orrella daihaiensis]UOD51719.1 DUF3426 domain-containing protein [Orrella daihaiensis]